VAVVPQKLRKLLVALMIVAALSVVVLLAVTTARPPPRPPLPSPNGYDDFVTAGGAVTGDLDNSSTLDHDALRDLIATNTESLRLLRLGLSRECAVPGDPSSTNFGAIYTGLIFVKRVASLLHAEGRFAEMENRTGDAARSYVDAIRLGNNMSRGGVVITRLVGIACENIGTIPLIKLLPQLNSEQTPP
jgi:hypothetical protein